MLMSGLKCMDCEADIWFESGYRIYYCEDVIGWAENDEYYMFRMWR